MEIAEKLKLLRKSVKMSQEHFGDMFHMKRSAYAAYESGRVKMDSEMLQKIAKHFGISLEQLIDSSISLEVSNSNSNKKNFEEVPIIENIKDINKKLGDIEKRLIHSESTNAVLKSTIDKITALLIGEKENLISSELNDLIEGTSKERMDKLRKKK